MYKFFLLTLLFPSIYSLSCLNSQGQEVAWWVYLKTPNSVYGNTKYFAMYYDSTMNLTDFEYITARIDHKGGALYNTLISTHSSPNNEIDSQSSFESLNSSISENTNFSISEDTNFSISGNLNSSFTGSLNESISGSLNSSIAESQNSSVYKVIAWNDGNPITGRTASAPTAHSKGVIGLDLNLQKGFYMQHSMPKYPNIIDGQINPEIDDSQLRYGQNMMCLSVGANTLEEMAQNLLIIKGNVYFASDVNSSYPSLELFANRKYNRTIPSLNLNFTLYSGFPMKMFSKSGYFPLEYIFSNQMVPALSTSLHCETWGRPYQNATCDIGTQDYFIKEILYLNFSQSEVTWKSTMDHSKWTISADENSPWVCFGDINKMASQSKRGGSYFCMLHDQLWRIMNKAITQTQDCIESLDSEENQEKRTLQQLIYEALGRELPN